MSDKQTSLQIVRRYNASPEEVWFAWTDPKVLQQWLGPDETASATAETDVRVGGRYRFVLKMRNADEHEASGVYQEVIANERFVATWAWKSTPEQVSRITVTLRPSGTGTELTLIHDRLLDKQTRDSHQGGWAGAFAKLDRLLS